MIKFSVLVIWALAFNKVIACSPPILSEELVLNVPYDGSYKVVPAPTHKALLFAELKKSKNVAIVQVGIEWHGGKEYRSAYTEFKTHYGWGENPGRVIKYYRNENSCGKPKKLKVGGYYVVVIESGMIFRHFEYEEVKSLLKSKEGVDYRFGW